MQTVTTIGLDIAKSVLQVHGVEAAGKVVNARTPLPAAGGRLTLVPDFAFAPAYETDLTLDELRSGPCELDGEAFDWGDRSRPYQHPHYWSV